MTDRSAVVLEFAAKVQFPGKGLVAEYHYPAEDSPPEPRSLLNLQLDWQTYEALGRPDQLSVVFYPGAQLEYLPPPDEDPILVESHTKGAHK